MNEYFVLAFIVMPIVVLTMGVVALRLHDWDLRRQRDNTPAE